MNLRNEEKPMGHKKTVDMRLSIHFTHTMFAEKVLDFLERKIYSHISYIK